MAEEALLVLSEPSAVHAVLQFRRFIVRALACALAALAAALVSIAPAQAIAPASKGPPWAELTAGQQEILGPLKPEWESMDRQPRLKWVGIAKRFPSMSPREQRRIQTRMQRWAKLTPEQRLVARNNYRKNVGALPPEQKKELQVKWQEYQALPEHEKRSLATKAVEPAPAPPPRRPRGGVKPGGTPAQPVPINDR